MARAEYTGKLFYVYLDSDRAWELIEQKTMGYNVDIDILYPEHFNTDKNKAKYTKIMNKLVMEGEQYNLLSGICEGYAVTSFGRVINTKKVNQVKVYFKTNDVIAHIRSTKIYLSTEFANNGWSFNINTIKHIYNENKWEYKQSMFNRLYHSSPR